MAFFLEHKKLLQGHYEADRLPSDFSPDRIVPDFAFNVLNPLGLLYRPVVDEDYLASGGKKPVWPDGKSFAVCLTHDVHNVTSFSAHLSIRKLTSRLRHSNSPIDLAKRPLGFFFELFQIFKNFHKPDPLHCYEKWLEIESIADARSTFFFWPGLRSIGKRHPTDCFYQLSDKTIFEGQRCSINEMIREIDRSGCEIGLHPSWHSYNDTNELKRQKDAIETTLGHEIFSVRQHYLHYDIRITPKVHAEAGFKYDSSLGFNNNIGFRFGTCYPWRLFNLMSNQELPIIEIPLIIQDGAMLGTKKGMQLNKSTAFDYIKMITETVESVGGVLTLLWHGEKISDKTYCDLYLRILNYLKEKNPWFGTVKEVGEYWNQNNEQMLNNENQ